MKTLLAIVLLTASVLAQDAPWLQLNTHNPTSNATLKPKWTVIISSVRPTVKQIDTNRWEIEFHDP